MLVKFVTDKRLPASVREQDRFRMGEARAAMTRKDYATLFHLLDCAPERQWPTLGYDLAALRGYYQAAAIAVATEKKGGDLTWRERNAAIRNNTIPLCLRAIGH